MNKERQRKLAARARRMESLHPTSNNEIATNEETKTVEKIEKKQKNNSGSIQKKSKKDVSVKASVKKPNSSKHDTEHKKKHNSKVKGVK